MDKTYVKDIEKDTLDNDNFRKVVYTGQQMQLVMMSLLPGEEIGAEVHHDIDQFFRVESGSGLFVLEGEEITVSDDWAAIAPAGSEHNIINNSDEVLKFYTIYAPAEHPDGTVHKDKAEADRYEAEHHSH